MGENKRQLQEKWFERMEKGEEEDDEGRKEGKGRGDGEREREAARSVVLPSGFSAEMS